MWPAIFTTLSAHYDQPNVGSDERCRASIVESKKRTDASEETSVVGDTGRRIPELVTNLVGWRNPTNGQHRAETL